MPKYEYKAMNMNAERVSGKISAASDLEARAALAQEGLMDITLRAVGSGHGQKVSSRDLSIFCRQMSLIMFSDISLLEGISVLIEQTGNPTLKKALIQSREDMNEVNSFSQAIQRRSGTFPPYLLDMISLGEQSGTLDVVFAQMADYYEKEHRMWRKVRASATYPLILTVLMIGVVVLLITNVLPMFEGILSSMGSEMPPMTRAMMGFSRGLGFVMPFLLVIIFLLVIAGYFYRKSEKGALLFDRLKVQLPILRMVNVRVMTARFARSLSLLLKSGVQILNALETLETLIGNRFVEAKFQKLREDISDGDSLVQALEKLEIFPPLFLRMVSIGNQTGNIDTMLDKTAVIFDDEVDDALEKLTTLIEPVLIIILSIIVAIILLSVMLPMINIMNNIGLS